MKHISINDVLFDESLYCIWFTILEKVMKKYGANYPPEKVWMDVKRLAVGVAESKHPVEMFRTRTLTLLADYYHAPYEKAGHPEGNPYTFLYNVTLGCLYTMVVHSAPRDVAQLLVEEMALYADSALGGEVTQVIRRVVDDFRHDRLQRDYNYTLPGGGIAVEEEEGNSECNENSSFEQQLKEKEELICRLKEQLNQQNEQIRWLTEWAEAHEEREPDEIKSFQKIKIEILRQLLERSGADIKHHGNGKVAGELVSYLTGIPYKACAKYVGYTDDGIYSHSKELESVNNLFKKLKMDLVL